jgi:glucose-1-phosphate thymidylyltransferase
MTVLILAAGYATRLYPLTLDTPKPLLKVGKAAIIEHIFEKITQLDDLKACFIITNSKFFDSFRDWAAAFRFRAPIEVIDDKTTSNETRLGAVRDIEFAIRQKDIKDDLLVIGGDNLFEFSLKRFVDFAQRHRPDASFDVFDIQDKKKASLYGVVETDAADNRVMGFEEKPAAPRSTLISTCVYYFPTQRLKFISDFIASGSRADATGDYIRWLSQNSKVFAFAFKEAWYDIGDLKSLKEADRKYSKKVRE